MAVDRGGLDYRIRVVDDFSTATERFRSEIRASRAEFAGLQADMAKSGQETRQAASAQRDAARATDVRTEAERKLARELRAVSVERETQALADRQQIARTREFVSSQRLQNAATRGALQFERERARLQQASARTDRTAAIQRQTRALQQQADRVRAVTQQQRLQNQVEQAALAVSRERAALTTRQTRLEQADAKAREARRAVEASVLAQQIAQQQAQKSSFSQFLQQTEATNQDAVAARDRAAAQAQFAANTERATTATKAQAKATKDLTAQGAKAGGVFQNLFFTFRRLIGVFAAFFVARQIVGGLVSAVQEAVRFNAELESAQLGIAAVITAAGQVRTPLGEAATSAQQFALAQQAAAEQVKRIRRDALATSATFEQLLQTFQVALGPGLAAGLNLDEVRRLTVRISQAASAIGLEQNQLAEEVRSILSGTIQLRTTRIAAVLGITNQDIKNARELGILAEFLDEKFRAFSVSGEASLQTFNVILSNLGDAISNLLAAGGEGLFNSLRSLFQDLSSSIATVNQELGEVELNPEAVAVVEAFLDGLRGAVDAIRQAFGELSFGDILQTAQAAGSAIAGTARVLAEVVVQFIRGANVVAGIFNALVRAARSVGEALGFLSFLGPVLSVAAQLLATFLSIRLVLVAIRGVATFIFGTALARGLTAVLGLNRALVAQVGLWQAIRLAVASNPIGFALTAVTAVLTVILGQMGVFDRLFGGVAEKADLTKDAVLDLRTAFTELDAQIGGALDTAGKFGENIRDLTDDLREATLQSQFDQATTGVTSGLKQQIDAVLAAELDLQKRTKDIDSALQVGQQNLLGLQRQRAAAARELTDATVTQRDQLEIVEDSLRDQLALQQQQARVESDIASQRLAVTQATAEGDQDALSIAQAKLRGLEAEQQALEGQAQVQEALVDRSTANFQLLVQTGQLTAQQAEELLDLAQRRVDLEGKEVAEAGRIAELTAQRTELEGLINDILAQRTIALIRENVEGLNRENVELELQARQLERIQRAREGLFGVETQATRIAAAANEVDQQQVALNELLIQQETDLANAKQLAADQTDPTARAFAEAQVLALQRNQNQELENQGRILADVNRQLLLRKAELESPFKLGFTKAVEEFSASALNVFNFAVETMTAGLEAFSELISTSIADAFDPSKDVDLKARFASFLNDLFALIIDFFVKVAVAKAALAIFGTATGTGPIAGIAVGNSPVSFKRGGVAPSSGGAAGWAHFGPNARAYALGGLAGMGPPAGVPRSDTVPAWLTPGEPVTPVREARRLGYDFFEAIRQGKIDPSAVRLLMGSMGLVGLRSRTQRGLGMADGGVASAVRAASAVETASAGIGIATVAPTERAAARQAAGGRRSRMRATAQDLRELRTG